MLATTKWTQSVSTAVISWPMFAGLPRLAGLLHVLSPTPFTLQTWFRCLLSHVLKHPNQRGGEKEREGTVVLTTRVQYQVDSTDVLSIVDRQVDSFITIKV